MMPQRGKILVVSHDPDLADIRRRVLENAGFEVVAASDAKAIKTTCAEHKLLLVMMGYSLPPSEKRRVWAEVKEHCEIPVLELHKRGEPELVSPAFFHESHVADDFLKTVISIVKRKN
jgi:DNA-binding response OmpR family regulator